MTNPLVNISPRIFLLFNFISFQSAWLVAVKLQQQGLLILIAILVMHFLVAQQRQRDWMTLIVITVIGSLVDLMAAYAGLFVYKEGNLLPLWLLLLWANFALTFHYSMGWLVRCPLFIQAILGGAFGSLSYFAAHKLGAVDYPAGIPLTIISLVVIWSLALPVYVFIARTIRGRYHESKTQSLSDRENSY
ncbi:DUF2878 domain-containing protein [Psychromonas antarctica]|jgi:hypothetical protein|uniref:DUF2878 domain-containing protein n=1 Tax=Psychromonas antarctica TaxID=67573 RepID=UPI001EE825C4|nr:DUF2878 domain-containing protein [Psychromonas antarctica]MCG6202073.1 DUF2878 domain-containing protein [Psychromonas antarctica]